MPLNVANYSIVKVPPLESIHTAPTVSSSPTERIPCAKFIAEGVHLPYGSALVSGREWMDCRGAQGLIPDALNPTAWGAACRNARGKVETFRNIGGISKDHKAQGFSVSLPRATGSAAVVAVGLSRFD